MSKIREGTFVEADINGDKYYGTLVITEDKVTHGVGGLFVWCFTPTGGDILVPIDTNIPLREADPLQHDTTVIVSGEQQDA